MRSHPNHDLTIITVSLKNKLIKVRSVEIRIVEREIWSFGASKGGPGTEMRWL
jgi:hypothetical protein